METKELGARLEIKAPDRGEVEAVVATIGVVDKDGDVLTPGAVADGSRVKMSSYGHDVVLQDAPPAGKGTLSRKGMELVFDGRLFLTTQRGRETLAVLKELGPDGEWSFGFRVVESRTPDRAWAEAGARRILAKLEALEVSPVFRGAGFGTGTTSIKACAAHAGACSTTLPAEADVPAWLRSEADALAGWAATRWGVPAPDVKFYAPDARPMARGTFFKTDPGAVYLSSDLRGAQLAETTVHEVAHYARHYGGHPNDEGEVEVDTAYLLHHLHTDVKRIRKSWDYQY